ncbi:hypothetical protein HBA55_35160 [Pseudomaricurvus alkylphenolicus]|uniref:hypothetical protein n=1 Tax=Pseudomaricurvus alkylphenolicus TaxID=1306991 RepID=UPI0014209BA0|nr:hypothetical protein [Pseudomaricurvus alkylphenolicus]NIB44871.1 hypothetical protein [Pseudomaricurvus alkylphenolicus]
MDEIKLLQHIIELSEEQGKLYGNVHFSADDRLVEQLYERYSLQPTIEELKALADKAYARGWIEYAYLEGSNHNGLKLTAKGAGAARSKLAQEKKKHERSAPKRVSDYIEEHKGLFVLLGAVVAFTTLVIRLTNGDN